MFVCLFVCDFFSRCAMQGKDNDVIIVSLVRSNPSSTIGFLSSINRLCVAISRARFALYLFGNSAALSNSSKKGWKVSEIRAFSLLSRSSVSQSIPLSVRLTA